MKNLPGWMKFFIYFWLVLIPACVIYVFLHPVNGEGTGEAFLHAFLQAFTWALGFGAL